MFARLRQIGIPIVCLVCVGMAAPRAFAHQWSSAMGEARALERAAKELHKIVDRTREACVAQASGQLSESVCAFVERLNRGVCSSEILESQREVAVNFDAVAQLVDAHALLRHDGRVASVLGRFARHFNRLDEKIRHALNSQHRPPSPWIEPSYRRPSWFSVPAASPGDWHPSHVPGYVSPGSWHYTNVPGATLPGDWHQSNVPGYVSPGSWHYTNSLR